MNPECSKYNIWSGLEIEGHTGLGEETLFIRKLEVKPADLTEQLLNSFTRNGKRTRVWFCKEFKNWKLLKVLSNHFKTVCLEVEMGTQSMVPRDIYNTVTIYLKVPIMLKPGDHVCVGPAFSDEAFKIGTGKRVNPDDYKNDKKIC